jgi:6-pyruvoyl-tetrahydropterin synthase
MKCPLSRRGERHSRPATDCTSRVLGLNTDVEWLRGLNPTTEMLASVFWDRLETHLSPRALWSVRVGETEKNWAERQRILSA